MGTKEGHLTSLLVGQEGTVVGDGFLEEVINPNHIVIKETT